MSINNNITVRLQTNINTKRLQIPPDATVEQLRQLVAVEYNITDPSLIYFSKEKDKADVSAPGIVLDPQKSLSSQGIKHGDFLYILGRLKTTVVDKTTINSEVSELGLS
jgi:uncharacterized ubiquitin-like protein YukD